MPFAFFDPCAICKANFCLAFVQRTSHWEEAWCKLLKIFPEYLLTLYQGSKNSCTCIALRRDSLLLVRAKKHDSGINKFLGISLSTFCSFQKAVNFVDLHLRSLAVWKTIHSRSNFLYFADIVLINRGRFRYLGSRD